MAPIPVLNRHLTPPYPQQNPKGKSFGDGRYLGRRELVRVRSDEIAQADLQSAGRLKLRQAAPVGASQSPSGGLVSDKV